MTAAFSMIGCFNTNPATPIRSLAFGSVFKYNSQFPTKYIASDTFSSTWADDGNIYTINDDSISGNWQATPPSSNMAISQLSGFTTALTGSIVNVMAGFGTHQQNGSDSKTFKAEGLISVSGVLYAFVCRQATTAPSGRYTNANAQLIKSTDHGATWTPQPPSTANPYVSPMFTHPNFSGPVFIQYGQDYQGNTLHNSNLYVYATSTNGFWNNGDAVYLGRCLISAIGNMSASDWSFYTGGDGMVSGNWSSSPAAAVPIISSPLKLGIAGGQLLPAFGRYMMLQWSYPSVTAGLALDTTSSIWDVYEAPTPWGDPANGDKWNLIQTTPWNAPKGLYNGNVIPKSLVTDGGRTLMIAAAGDFFSANAQTGEYTLQLVSAAVS